MSRETYCPLSKKEWLALAPVMHERSIRIGKIYFTGNPNRASYIFADQNCSMKKSRTINKIIYDLLAIMNDAISNLFFSHWCAFAFSLFFEWIICDFCLFSRGTVKIFASRDTRSISFVMCLDDMRWTHDLWNNDIYIPRRIIKHARIIWRYYDTYLRDMRLPLILGYLARVNDLQNAYILSRLNLCLLLTSR